MTGISPTNTIPTKDELEEFNHRFGTSKTAPYALYRKPESPGFAFYADEDGTERQLGLETLPDVNLTATAQGATVELDAKGGQQSTFILNGAKSGPIAFSIAAGSLPLGQSIAVVFDSSQSVIPTWTGVESLNAAEPTYAEAVVHTITNLGGTLYRTSLQVQS